MPISVNLPSGSTILTEQKIIAALGGTPLLIENLDKYVVTGITFNGDEEVHKGVVDVTLEALGLEKLEDFDPETVLDALTRESIEKLLGNEAFAEEKNNGIYDILTDIVELLGMDDEEGAEESLLKRVQDLEAEVSRLEDDKMDKDDFTREAVEKILGNTAYDEEEGNGILDQLQQAQTDIKDIEDALGLGDESDPDSPSIMDRLEAVEDKATTNASDIKDLQDALGDLGLEDDETLADVIDDLKSKDTALEDSISDIEDVLGLPEDYDADEDGTILDRIEKAEEDIETNAGNISTNASDIKDLQDALGLEEGYDPEEDGTIADRLGQVETDVKDIQDTLGDLDLDEGQTLADKLEEMTSAADDTYLKQDEFTRAAVLELIGENIESGDDKYINYTLPQTKWSAEMVANEEYDETEAEKGDYDVPETIPSGFQVAKITAADLGLETIGEPSEYNIEVLLQNSAGYLATLCASEAVITGYEQKSDYFTLHALNEVFADLPLIIVIDKINVTPEATEEEEDEEEVDSKD